MCREGNGVGVRATRGEPANDDLGGASLRSVLFCFPVACASGPGVWDDTVRIGDTMFEAEQSTGKETAWLRTVAGK